ncbi:MAG: RDD family protein [Phenylobacterium zucineum]|nr:MAG: RDD family protein [Phenylobacterium zucineum]
MKGRRVRREPATDQRELVTPEGVDLSLKVGSYVERFCAVALDMLILLGGMLVLSLVVTAVYWATKAQALLEGLGIVWLLAVFLGRNFYFFYFEAQPRAATPGKRIMGLRVIGADGGALTADAVFARNAMREVEVFLPLTFFLARSQVGVDAALITLGAIWSGVFVVFPLFNRDRRRLGDLAAGTLVVKAPRKVLQPDLADTERTASRGLTFTPPQLDAYGIKELHVLEDVIRAADRRAMKEVAERIRVKIGWDGPADIPDRTFLNAYYAALRGRLESRMLFGHRRKDKFDVS